MAQVSGSDSVSGSGSGGGAVSIRLNRIGRYETGEFDGGAEIVSYHPGGQRLFVINSQVGQIEVLDLSDPTSPGQEAILDAGDAFESAGDTNSVDVHGDVVAVAVANENEQADGRVAFYDAASLDLLATTRVGPLPDMVTFTPDGSYAVVANEGEPGDTSNPRGSVSVIDTSGDLRNATVRTAGFREFDGREDELRADGVRLVNKGPTDEVTVSQAIEPEYVAPGADSRTAFVSLQENNAIATVDLESATVTDVSGLGIKDFSLPGNELDTSTADGSSLQNWPIEGMYQPDAIDSYTVAGDTFVVTANEGDIPDGELTTVAELDLDPEAFELSENPFVDSVAELQAPQNLGELEVTEALGDVDGDGLHEEIYAIGGRSFAVWRVDDDGLQLVFDSGSQFERILAEQYPGGEGEGAHYNVDESGPETESVVLGEVGGRTYAFVGQEKGSAIVAYDVTAPASPDYVQTAVNRDFSVDEDDLEADAEANPDNDEPGRAGDFAPEGITFVPAADSPIDNPLVCVGYEISGTVGVFEVSPVGGAGTDGDGTGNENDIDGDGDFDIFDVQALLDRL
jgi:hypothetical protein